MFGVSPIFIIPDKNVTVNWKPGPADFREYPHHTITLHICDICEGNNITKWTWQYKQQDNLYMLHTNFDFQPTEMF